MGEILIQVILKPFQDQFKGKKIFDEDGSFTSIDVVKGAISEDMKEHAVDGITGGTVTSHGTRDMLERTLSKYVTYFRSKGNVGKKAS